MTIIDFEEDVRLPRNKSETTILNHTDIVSNTTRYEKYIIKETNGRELMPTVGIKIIQGENIIILEGSQAKRLRELTEKWESE